jgi:hypothetical protein
MERGCWCRRCYIMAERGGLGARGRGAVEVSLTLTRRMDPAHMCTGLGLDRKRRQGARGGAHSSTDGWMESLVKAVTFVRRTCNRVR